MSNDIAIGSLQEKIDDLNQQAWEARVTDLPRSLELSQESVKLARSINYPRGLAEGLRSLGFSYVRFSKNDQAAPLLKESLSLFQSLNDLKGQAVIYEYLGIIERNWGNLGTSLDLLLKANEIVLQTGTLEVEITCSYQLGVTYKHLGNHENALDYLYKTLSLAKKMDFPLMEAYATNIIGSIYFDNGNYEQALDCYQQGLPIRRQSHDKWGEAGSLDNIGFTYLKLNDLDKAIEYCKQSLAICQGTGDKKGEANALLHLAEIYEQAGDVKQAAGFSNESLEIRKERGDKRGETEVLLFLADLYKHSHDVEDHQIFEWLSGALKIADEIKAQDLLSKAYYNLHEYYQQKGNFKESLVQLEAHFQLEKVLHKNAINQKISNLEISHKAEVISQRNKELTELNEKIEKANEELKIERSLERVRTAAMAMKEPADMLEVCKIISDQLELLDVKKIRNVQTAIFYEGKGVYMNYEYYAKHDKQLITEVDYKNHHVAEKFANQMLKGPNEVFAHGFTGKEVREWLDYQKTTNVFIDTYLETADSLNYYWYSLGPVALGLSTYVPLNENEIDLFKRFRNVFELAYRRYLDIEKAQAQAREAKIETALERVRSNTMAMHHSEELKEVISVTFEQIKSLDIIIDSCIITLFIDGSDDLNNWVASAEQKYPHNVRVPYFKHPLFDKIVLAKNQPGSYFTIKLSQKENQAFYKHIIENSGFGKIINEDRKRSVMNAESNIMSFANFRYTGLRVGNFRDHTYTDEENNIILRFANVFEQTYTRFLDLQKAEAQAREAQIEASLERIRSKATSIRNSNELLDVIHTVFGEWKKLGLDLYECNINLLDRTTKEWTNWGTGVGDAVLPKSYKLPWFDHPFLNQVHEDVLAGVSYRAFVVEGAEYRRFVEHLFTNTDFKNSPKEYQDALRSIGKIHSIHAYMQYGSMDVIGAEPLPDAAGEILKRFAKVFEQAYRRYLDIVQAEAQAREARIEAALERARTQSMIMQHSTELDDTLRVFHEQVLLLGINSAFSFLWLPDEDKERHIFWAAWAESVSIDPLAKKGPAIFKSKAINYPLDRNEPATAQCLVDWKGKQPVVSYHVAPAGVESYFAAWQELIAGVEQLKPEYFSDGLYYVEAFMKYGCFGVMVATDLTEDEKKILLRFTIEFERTYTRFLDLQKAEAQSRESQIELGLERVRAKAMAMQKSDELKELIGTVYTELTKLDLILDRCFIMIFDNKSMGVTWWMSNPEAPLKPVGLFVKYHEQPPYLAFIKGWKERSLKWQYVLEGEVKKTWDKFLFVETELSYLPDFVIANMKANEKVYLSASFNNFGCLTLATLESLSDEHFDIMLRFAKVFDLTYTRFNDLKQAEAQTREAKIEAALERVRAKAMAMHKSDDLKPAVATVFEELDKLNLGLIRCGIAILDKEKPRGDIWITIKSDHGNTIGISGDESLDIHPLLRGAYDAWLKLEDFSYVLQNDDLIGYYQAITKTNFQQPVSATFTAEKKDQQQYYFNAVFQHGSLFAFLDTAFTDEAKMVMKRFANVFNLTYKRFLDLQKAEAQAREAKIEAALERVRARALAMQEPEELKEVAQVLRTEMGLLGVEELETCSIYINDESAEKAECWYALKDTSSEEKKLVNDHFVLNLNDTWVGREMLQFYRSSKKLVSIVMQGENRREWIRYCEKNSAPLRGYYGEVIPDRTYHLYKFSHGAIGAASAGEISEESWRMLNRAASVFSLAYSRFKDLTQARTDLVKLKEEKKRAEDALTELQATQKQLIQSEKMASLGELTAGIAHEIQNPLNFVNNFSDVSNELLEEMKTELEKGNAKEAKAIAIDVKENLEKILHHGKRADAIVKGMLQHSRGSGGQKELTDINTLAEEYLRLAYHGLRAKDKFFNAKFETDLDPSITKINIVPQEIGRVILNLINNSFYAVSEKKKLLGNGYEPAVTVSTKTVKPPPSGGGLGVIEIMVKDNGIGIPQKSLDKIFQPFFTTKPTGQGTGLGLSLSYDIVTKGHDGEIKVETKEGEGSAFTISLPMK